jgi:hypothetical protein
MTPCVRAEGKRAKRVSLASGSAEAEAEAEAGELTSTANFARESQLCRYIVRVSASFYSLSLCHSPRLGRNKASSPLTSSV